MDRDLHSTTELAFTHDFGPRMGLNRMTVRHQAFKSLP